MLLTSHRHSAVTISEYVAISSILASKIMSLKRKSNVLGLLYAALELEWGYIRAITPFYSVYDLSPVTTALLAKVKADKCQAASTIRAYWFPKGGGYQVRDYKELGRLLPADNDISGGRLMLLLLH